MTDPSRIQARYRFDAASRPQASAFAEFIAREQTVEVPENLVTSSGIGDEVLGCVERLEPVENEPDRWEATISYGEDLAANQLPQLLNLLYGILSCQPRVRLVDFELPPALQQRFPGPRHGVAGLRAALDAPRRPLLSTALKPKGVAVSRLVEIARGFAEGGGDILKDDHNLVEESADAFRDRVRRVHDALEDSAQKRGERTLYFPTVSAPWPEMEERLAFLVETNVPGVLLAPYLLGLETTRWLGSRFPLLLMAHPTLSGVFFAQPGGVAVELVLGRLLRMIGMDISIFPNAGGRYPMRRNDGVRLARELRKDTLHWRPALPAPAGGMTLGHVPEVVADYGRDVVLLVGGALLTHSEDLAASTRLFRERLESA